MYTFVPVYVLAVLVIQRRKKKKKYIYEILIYFSWPFKCVIKIVWVCFAHSFSHLFLFFSSCFEPFSFVYNQAIHFFLQTFVHYYDFKTNDDDNEELNCTHLYMSCKTRHHLKLTTLTQSTNYFMLFSHYLLDLLD